MKTKEINCDAEMMRYYDALTNSYIFKEKNQYIDLVKFNYDINILGNIQAKNIIAKNIICNDIIATKIIAKSLKANNINVVEKLLCREINAKNIIKATFIKSRYIKANNIYSNYIEAVEIVFNLSTFIGTIYTCLLSGKKENLHYSSLTIKRGRI